jgi:hypothetical protein
VTDRELLFVAAEEFPRSASEQDKARATIRRWPQPLAEEPRVCEGRSIWFGNEGEDIDPRFERDETL